MSALNRLTIALMFNLAIVGGAGASEYMSPVLAMEVLADGKPWNTAGSNRPKAKITFNSDGSGLFEGPITMDISWKTKGDEICIDLKMAGTKCVRFKNVNGSYEGYANGQLDLTLSRQ